MKKLLIICEERYRHHGDFLAQLISLRDDRGDEIVGIKDGTAAAQVWSEKEYTANAAQISSEQYILFIGNTAMTKKKRTNMKQQFSKFGMRYGWLGKQACLFVEEAAVHMQDIDDFVAFALQNEADADKLGELKELDDKFVEKTGSVPMPILLTLGLPKFYWDALQLNTAFLEQQYSCLVWYFYQNGLASFMELNEA